MGNSAARQRGYRADGKGFAVVAEEIGNLAIQTRDSVQNIETIIGEVNEAVNNLATCLNTSMDFLESTVMEDYGEFLNVSEQYAKDATNFESGMREIAESVEQLDRAIDHIAVSMEDIGKMTNEAANGVSLVAEKTVEIVEKMTDEEREENKFFCQIVEKSSSRMEKAHIRYMEIMNGKEKEEVNEEISQEDFEDITVACSNESKYENIQASNDTVDGKGEEITHKPAEDNQEEISEAAEEDLF